MKMRKSELVNTYAQSIGIGAARELINKKINAAALEDKESYTGEAITRICGELEKEGGLVRIVAQTFRVRMERRKSEEQGLLLDNIETQIWYLTDVNTYGAVNRARAEFLGREKEDVEDKSIYDLIGREESDICSASNRKVFDGKKQVRTEVWAKNSREEARLLSITKTPKLNSDGDVEYVICAAEDITARRAAEERIRHLNSVLKAIRNVNQLIVVEKDRNKLIKRACDALIEAKGYDAAWLALSLDHETFAAVTGSGFEEYFSRFCDCVVSDKTPSCIKNTLLRDDQFTIIDRSQGCGGCPLAGAHTGNDTAIARLEHAGKFFGLIAVSLAPDFAVDEEARGLLEEAASDISFALHDIELEEKHNRAVDALKESEARYRALFETAKDAIFLTDEVGRFVNVNKAACNSLGYSREELLEMHISDIDADTTGQEEFRKVRNGMVKESTFEVNHRKKDGTLLPVEVTGNFFEIGGRKLSLAIVRDITERKQAEYQIKKSLYEKEVMLQEIHHRVKNNLQVVASLLSMQARATSNQSAKDALTESMNRLNTMALIHVQLYGNSDLSEINMRAFVNTLLKQLLQCYMVRNTKITPTVNVADYPFPISIAVPAGLIINELLANVLKHAFIGRVKGAVKISIIVPENGKISLTVSDDGVGLPDGFDINATTSFGLRLVRILAEDQLHGTLSVTRGAGAGTAFKIEFGVNEVTRN
ncbi:MAG: PAS domain S-box protein [Methanosarcinales archaeon]|nr:MAG: PAS domain S-box protein [Methanosarcinales archaeon]